MKLLSAFASVLLALTGHCASLQWDPSPSSTNAPAPAFYRVYFAFAAAPSNAVWTAYGETTSTNLFITNNVYRMFTVRGVSGAGTESDNSNVVTNHFAPPNPPGKAIITGAIEGANQLGGPWTVLATNQIEVPIESTNQFFRQSMRIAIR